MSAFDNTHLGLTVKERELVLLLTAAVAKLSEISKHPAAQQSRRKEAVKFGTTLQGMYYAGPRHAELVANGSTRKFQSEVEPILQDILIRKAED